MKKKCTKCHKLKLLSEFPLHPRMKFGVYGRCKLCHKSDNAIRYRLDHGYQDSRKASALRYKRAHPGKYAKWSKTYSAKLRLEVLKAYGNKCACCGETSQEFLTFDHVKGDGGAHRRSFNGKRSNRPAWQELRQHGYPQGLYRVLCYNCNFSRGHRGYCPHEREVKKLEVV